jgi:hypothetical protein
MYVCAELELKIMTNPVYIHKYFLLIVKKSFFCFFLSFHTVVCTFACNTDLILCMSSQVAQCFCELRFSGRRRRFWNTCHSLFFCLSTFFSFIFSFSAGIHWQQYLQKIVKLYDKADYLPTTQCSLKNRGLLWEHESPQKHSAFAYVGWRWHDWNVFNPLKEVSSAD